MSNPINDTIHGAVDSIQAVRASMRSSVAEALKGVLPAGPASGMVDAVVRTDETVSNAVADAIKQASTTVSTSIEGLTGRKGSDSK